VNIQQHPWRPPQVSPARTTPTTYLSRAAWEQLDAAQAIVDQHAASRINGVCPICRIPDPCPARASAAERISRYGLLPKRRGGRLDNPDEAQLTRRFIWFNEGLVGAR
jgi:hypothetical protein